MLTTAKVVGLFEDVDIERDKKCTHYRKDSEYDGYSVLSTVYVAVDAGSF